MEKIQYAKLKAQESESYSVIDKELGVSKSTVIRIDSK